MLTAQIGDRNAGLMLLQDSDDLLFRKAATLHALVLVMGQNETSNWIKSVRQGQPVASGPD
jgi:hypothetical protein